MDIVTGEQASLISEYWRPKAVGALNGQEVKLAKFHGTFVWHHHVDEDELFLGLAGRFTVDFPDRAVEINPGEFLIGPRGVEHRTVAAEEATFCCSNLLRRATLELSPMPRSRLPMG